MLLDKKPIFFKGTIEDNLARVTHSIGKNELSHIFALTGFDEHLLNLPEGIHTTIDETATRKIPDTNNPIPIQASAKANRGTNRIA